MSDFDDILDFDPQQHPQVLAALINFDKAQAALVKARADAEVAILKVKYGEDGWLEVFRARHPGQPSDFITREP